MFKYDDLTIGSNGRVRVFNMGFLEDTHTLSMACEKPLKIVIKGKYRINADAYKTKQAVFDEWIARQGRKQ